MNKRLDRVTPQLVDIAISRSTDIHQVYGQCVKAWYQSTGKLDVGFNARDMVDWIKINHPNLFDEKGKKIGEVENGLYH